MNGTEAERELLQARLDALKTQRDRRTLGQFATPGSLATEVVEATRALVGASSDRIAFMDPAFGTGAFYSALLRVLPRGSIGVARGFEIDPHYGRPAAALWEAAGLRLELDDFTSRRPTDRDDLVDLVICNPPYVRHHHIELGMKRRLAAQVERSLRIRVSGLAGLYVYFMLVGHRWLKPNALSAWLVPSEFDDAMVSSAVVWFRNRRPTDKAPEFTLGGSVASPRARRRIGRDTLRGEPKWTRFPGVADAAPLPQVADPADVPTLADFFAIKRGLVTGANRYFVMNEQKARESGISPRFLRPVLPSPRHLQTNVVNADAGGMPEIDGRLLLFDCRVPPDELERTEPKTAAYVRLGEAADVHKGYLASRREPWYAQERRSPAPLLVTYMGRSLKGRPPFRIILNNSKAVATNVYLMLYPKPLLDNALASAAGREVLWRALRRTIEAEWTSTGRVYGGGLHKVEPSELGRMPAARLIDGRPELHREAVLQPTLL